jgi:hypothetical protein
MKQRKEHGWCHKLSFAIDFYGILDKNKSLFLILVITNFSSILLVANRSIQIMHFESLWRVDANIWGQHEVVRIVVEWAYSGFRILHAFKERKLEIWIHMGGWTRSKRHEKPFFSLQQKVSLYAKWFH